MAAERIGVSVRIETTGENMHIVRFKGGLGNQLFQLCLYKKLVDKYGTDSVYVDISYYSHDDIHGGFRLGCYGKLKYIQEIPEGAGYIDESTFDTEVLKEGSDYLYDGYWQDEKFLPEDLDFIKVLLETKIKDRENRLLKETVESCQSVSVHIRRGDYVENYVHGNIANLTYIKKAVEYMKNSVVDPSFFVFTDDADWCRRNLGVLSDRISIISDDDSEPENDIYMMSRCRHNIIANSSYSWWAQKLNDNAGKIVISPEYWVNERRPFCNLLVNSFVKIRNVPDFGEVNNNPKFSFLIPVYNREDVIKRCLASVLNQDYGNIEIIVIDDGSDDNTYSVLEKYAEHDKRIRIFKNNNRESALISRIKAMRKAIGEYILFLDSDDYYSYNAVSVLRELLEEKPVEILEFAYIREPERRIVVNSDMSGNSYLEDVLTGKSPHTLWNKVYSSGLIRRVLDNVDEFYCNISDDMYLYSIITAMSSSYRYVENVLYHYVSVDGVSTSRSMDESAMKDIILSLTNKEKYLKRFIGKVVPELTELTDAACQNDRQFVVGMCKRLKQPVGQRIYLIRMFDKAFGTDYSNAYESEIEDALKLYEELRTGGIVDKTKYVIKKGLNYLAGSIRRA